MRFRTASLAPETSLLQVVNNLAASVLSKPFINKLDTSFLNN